MKDSRRRATYFVFVTALICVLGAAGCDDRSVSQAELALQRRYERDYEEQKRVLERQNAEWERQLEKIEEQDARYDAILAKWEEHSERVDALLDRWDRILTVLEERSGDR